MNKKPHGRWHLEIGPVYPLIIVPELPGAYITVEDVPELTLKVAAGVEKA